MAMNECFFSVPWWYLAFSRMISVFLTQSTKSNVGPSKYAFSILTMKHTKLCNQEEDADLLDTLNQLADETPLVISFIILSINSSRIIMHVSILPLSLLMGLHVPFCLLLAMGALCHRDFYK